ncbi:hypothetical protein [Alienimonas chondri]|uniref:Uncharacterized protein n=1 Tax=Alienimonas chondri TaxID=2681879 RepID=A0ABX1VMP4_9PLAN|nr:hypothetical protein [Alienimonas chondri]NNJ28157.1 hypothetical protein [Alienimonas chondri]
MSDERETYGSGLSLTKTAVALGVVVALFAWGVAAAEYAADAEGWASVAAPEDAEDLSDGGLRRNRGAGLRLMIGALLAFLWNGVVQLPNAPWVIGFTLMNKPLIAVLFVLAELAIAGGAFFLRKLDAELHGDSSKESERPVRPRQKKKRRPTRRPPPGYG